MRLISVRGAARMVRDKIQLSRIERARIGDTSRLADISVERLRELFSNSPELAAEWEAAQAELAALGITARADGVNPGDRRALYYLVRHLKPTSVLEVGTHIGASTTQIALALRKTGTPARIVSVDIADVNDARTQPWLRFGSRMSPRSLVERVGMATSVEFVATPSVDYLARTIDTFDLIFLDGDHSARTVYREIPAAVRALKPGGAILLHDFFPEMKPLWPNSAAIPGGWLAVERLRREGAKLRALTLGELPWPTKLGTRRTSLAIVVRD